MIKLKQLMIEIKKKNWSAIVIDDKSRENLLNTLKDKIPKNWKVIAHHMTIDPFKPLNDKTKEGQSYTLKAIEFGLSDKACAVKVQGYDGKTNNKFPHITLAINDFNGGEAKDSNNITNWVKLEHPISVFGISQNL